ncbi:hypothetical protein [Micromonospora sp. NBC_01796]|uniref:hypothetical protein n=1 Tax=Micromonospora sp. NBC_01796 TaxID=2975987 RepID=UPI002DD837EE|nr:hypothetical protein [Micromonospora sp. NBC_01796]WSA83808.1 hypothetical protein OIE47_25985 [Micromonospora sp. NBC_01796]
MSWQTVWNELYPDTAYDPHDDFQARDMHRLRGLVMAQGAETEAALGAIARHLDPLTDLKKATGGQLAQMIRRRLARESVGDWTETLDLIDLAVTRRNHAVHTTVQIGSVWREYATGDGGWA